MKHSLSRKLFLTIFLAFILVISGLVLMLDLYFNNYYEDIKIKNTANAMVKLADAFKSSTWTDEELYREINIFSTTNNLTAAIKKDGEHKEGDSENHESDESTILVTAVDDDNNYYDFFLSNELIEERSLELGIKVYITGELSSDNVIDVATIDGNLVEGHTVMGNGNWSLRLVKINTELSVPSDLESDTSEYTVLLENKISGVSVTLKQLPYIDAKQADFELYITSKHDVKYTLVATTSLQGINETMAAIKGFYPYMFLLSVVVSIVIARIYSKSVARPIVAITSMADDISRLKFTKKLDEGRVDELGQLSHSLNTLSRELESALLELKDKNIKLENEYKKEKQQQQARKDFVANASHELKTPLGVIKSYAEGLKDGIAQGNSSEYLDVINDEVMKMSSLVQELLKISKYDSLDVVIKKTPCDLQMMIFDILQSFEYQMSDKSLLIKLEGDFEEVDADEEKLRSAVTNLISNAVKYSNHSSHIKISASSLDEKQHIEISNECTVLSDEELNRVWERFYKIDKAHDRTIEGTGLGLSIVKSIFEAHNITYGVKNTESGVCFWFDL